MAVPLTYFMSAIFTHSQTNTAHTLALCLVVVGFAAYTFADNHDHDHSHLRCSANSEGYEVLSVSDHNELRADAQEYNTDVL